MIGALSDIMKNGECRITSLVFKGIRDKECPSMQRQERKRPCKLNRESIISRLADLFSTCPLEELSVEGNGFAVTGLIELAQRISNGLFPSLRVLNIDGGPTRSTSRVDNNYNFDTVALQRLMRVIETIPSVDVRSFYVGTLSDD